MYFIRYRSRNHIDSPKDLLVVIIGVAVCMAMKYYLPKIIPGMSNKTVERVSYAVAVIIMVLFIFII